MGCVGSGGLLFDHVMVPVGLMGGLQLRHTDILRWCGCLHVSEQ